MGFHGWYRWKLEWPELEAKFYFLALPAHILFDYHHLTMFVTCAGQRQHPKGDAIRQDFFEEAARGQQSAQVS